MQSLQPLQALITKWRDQFVDHTWLIDPIWITPTPEDPHEGRSLISWELWYCRIEVAHDLPKDCYERVIVHELCELELWELGQQFHDLAEQLEDLPRSQAIEHHRRLRNRLIERRLRQLLPNTPLPVRSPFGLTVVHPENERLEYKGG